MSGSDQRLTVPQVARLLGISERGVRDKIEQGTLRAEKEGKRWIVLFPADDAVVRGSGSGSTSGSDAVVDSTGYPVEVAADIRRNSAAITPAEVERAIARTGQQYTADLQTILGELRAVYEGQIEAQRETIAELRRRAEVAEAELSRRRDSEQGTTVPTPEAAPVGPIGPTPAPRPWWRRLFGGE